METGSAPTVKLPDGVFRQNTLSGTNSWAQSSTTIKPMMKQTHHGQPTNRDKYENKPMPKLPVEESPAVVRSQPRYIPPAVPLVNPILQGQKMRAVTDPIQSRSVVNGKTPSITQLRKKFSSSRTDVTKIDEKEFLSYGDIPDKAQNVLGISIQRAATPSATANRRQTPAPTPFVPKSQTKLKQPLFQTKTGPSDLSSRGSIGSNHDKADLQMADGIRHHSDTAEDAIKHAQTPLQSDEAEKPAEGPSRPKIAAYGSVGKVGVIQKGALHPSGSFQGVIEMASPAKSEHDVPHRESPSAKLPSSSRSARPSEEFLNPVTYSPSNYGGIWENDPAVVRSQKKIRQHGLTQFRAIHCRRSRRSPRLFQTLDLRMLHSQITRSKKHVNQIYAILAWTLSWALRLDSTNIASQLKTPRGLSSRKHHIPAAIILESPHIHHPRGIRGPIKQKLTLSPQAHQLRRYCQACRFVLQTQYHRRLIRNLNTSGLVRSQQDLHDLT